MEQVKIDFANQRLVYPKEDLVECSGFFKTLLTGGFNVEPDSEDGLAYKIDIDQEYFVQLMHCSKKSLRSEFVLESRTNKKLMEEVEFFQFQKLREYAKCPVVSCYQHSDSRVFDHHPEIRTLDPLSERYSYVTTFDAFSKQPSYSFAQSQYKPLLQNQRPVDCLKYGMLSCNEISQDFSSQDKFILLDFTQKLESSKLEVYRLSKSAITYVPMEKSVGIVSIAFSSPKNDIAFEQIDIESKCTTLSVKLDYCLQVAHSPLHSSIFSLDGLLQQIDLRSGKVCNNFSFETLYQFIGTYEQKLFLVSFEMQYSRRITTIVDLRNSERVSRTSHVFLFPNTSRTLFCSKNEFLFIPCIGSVLDMKTEKWHQSNTMIECDACCASQFVF